MKRLYVILFILLLSVACDRQDLNERYRQAEENEQLVKQLEATLFDMNAQLLNLHNLTQALMKRLHLTGKNKTANGYLFTFSDSIRVEIDHGRTTVLEISPINGNWLINGEDSGVTAQAQDGVSPQTPQLRINPATLCWEFSNDGISWKTTDIQAKGETGDDAQSPVVAINNAGNWTIGGQETVPPLPAIAKDGILGQVPMVGIDKNQTPPVWTISSDGGQTWTPTGIPAQAENGETGDAATQHPYIQEVVVRGDSIIFTFNADLPGIVPATRIQKVALYQEPFAIQVTTAEWTNVGGRNWLLLGVSDNRRLTYTVTGGKAVSVDAIDLLAGTSVTIDETTCEVTVHSVSASAPVAEMGANGTFRLLAIDEKGKTTTCTVNVSLVYTFKEPDLTDSYVYEMYSPARNLITYLYYEDHGASKNRTRYYYGRFDFDNLPSPSTVPYPTTVTPLVATDIDGNRYKLCLFNEDRLLCFAENLKTTRYNDGSAIQNLTDPAVWAADRQGAYRWYADNASTNKDKYGALYNGYAVATSKLAPIGWRVATDDDWKKIEMNGGMNNTNAIGWRDEGFLGYQLKAPGLWDGAGRYCFDALPGGKCDSNGIQFLDAGTSGYWWSSFSNPTTDPFYYRLMQTAQDGIYRNNDQHMNTGMSVRCVKDL